MDPSIFQKVISCDNYCSGSTAPPSTCAMSKSALRDGPGPPPSKSLYDPWNSSSTGHQRAENRLSGSTSWRQSRSYKLSHQFRDTSGEGGAGHRADLVGAGSEHFGRDGRKENGSWEKGASGLREHGCLDIKASFASVKRKHDEVSVADEKRQRPSSIGGNQDVSRSKETTTPAWQPNSQNAESSKPKRLFAGINIYVNGSTFPMVSDHRLKQLLTQHGGNISVALGRKTVSHVIVGERGALAASKMEKEILRHSGKGVKYVSARW